MPYIKIWVHVVWATKNRTPYLIDEIRDDIFKHMLENARTKGIFIDHINGYTDHVHCLISLKANQAVADVARFIKGESSNWINKNALTKSKFGWQNEYYVSSISPSQIEAVRRYIRNQEKHHRKMSFQEEYRQLLEKAG